MSLVILFITAEPLEVDNFGISSPFATFSMSKSIGPSKIGSTIST
jgi:hypothetical protein